MGDCVDREVAMSQQDKEIETEAAWQAHYISWAQIMKVPDPCGHQRGCQRIVAIYIKYLMTGVNFLINNLVKEEDITRQCSPLDSAIFAKLLR